MENGNKAEIKKALAQYEAALSNLRAPKSNAFKKGCRTGMYCMIVGAATGVPYKEGTPQCDAWRAGMDEGMRIWRHLQQVGLDLNEANFGTPTEGGQ